MADRSPAAWLELLEQRLHARWGEWQVYDEYYEGDHRFSAWLRRVQVAFRGTVLGNLLDGLTDNYMLLVVDSAAERLRVQGFRFGDNADDKAWEIWQANGLDAQANMVHTEAIKLGEAYWLVEPPKNGDDPPRITAEHPSQVIVSYAPGDRRLRQAALKKWKDDDGFVNANVYLPDGVVKYRSQTKLDEGFGGQINWGEGKRFAHSLGVVPVIPMPNNPSMLRGGRSDLAYGAISLQDQITKTVADLLIGSEYHGLPQRVLLGVEPPRDENGRVISDMEAAKSRLWYFNNPDAKAHEFSQADLKGLREAADGFIGDLAAQTRIPIYYFRPQAISNLSAEALIGLDAGLVSKAHDKEIPFGEGHEEMAGLSFKAIGDDERAARTDTETIWANTESRSQAQVVDAAVKLSTIGVPEEALWERIGASPQQIDRWKAMAEADALTAESQVPPPSNGQVPPDQAQQVMAGATPGPLPPPN